MTQKTRKHQGILRRLRIDHSKLTPKFVFEKITHHIVQLVTNSRQLYKVFKKRRTNNIPNSILEALQNK